MVTSSYFTHPTTVYSKACTIPGFDIVATSPRRSRRSLAPPEGGGAGFAEFPAGGTTSNKSKIFWLWKEENYLLILTFTQSFSDQYTTCTYTNISQHFYWKRDLTLTSVLLIFLAFTDVVLSPLGIFPSLSKSVELSELAKTFLLLLPSINGIGSNKADLKRFEKSTLETKTLCKQIENTKLYNVIS